MLSAFSLLATNDVLFTTNVLERRGRLIYGLGNPTRGHGPFLVDRQNIIYCFCVWSFTATLQAARLTQGLRACTASHDPEFDSFVEGIMDTSFSSAFYPNEPEDFDMDDVILHNITTSDTDSESGVPNEGLPSTSGGNQNNDGLPGMSTFMRNYRPIPTNDNEWIDVTNFDQGPSTTIPICSVNTGPNLPTSFDHKTKPMDYFALFFNDDLLKYICDETNYFANTKKKTFVVTKFSPTKMDRHI
ncbi:hypothetical protein J6590_099048 [Homalodisca vitripennis]|nr:hypothetical protein J6590_099048 [Homalodisca vitripennis]